MRYWITALVVVLGGAAFAASIRWITADRDTRWSSYVQRYDLRVDQRWGITIAVGVDTVYAALGGAAAANQVYWLGLVIVVALQAIFLGAVLAVVRWRNGGGLRS